MNTKDTVLNIINIIEDNLKDITNIDSISEKLGLSKTYLNRVFNNILGLSVLDYIKKRKITEAITFSSYFRGNIIDIAFEYGFNSHEVFIRNCKRYFKKSPTEIIKIKSWNGFKRLNRESLWFLMNRDKIIIKKIILPQLVLQESEAGNFYIENYNFIGIHSNLEWDSKYTYKLIPGGTYLSYSIKKIEMNFDLLNYIKYIYENGETIIKYKSSNNSIYYIEERVK